MPAVDLDTCTLLTSASARTALTSIVFVTRNQRRIPFVFLRNGQPVELDAAATGEILIKAKGDFTPGSLASATGWTREGTGPSAVYYFTLSLLTEPLDEAFVANPEVLDNLRFELNFLESGLAQTCPAIPCTIYNKYLQIDEEVPAAAGDVFRITANGPEFYDATAEQWVRLSFDNGQPVYTPL